MGLGDVEIGYQKTGEVHASDLILKSLGVDYRQRSVPTTRMIQAFTLQGGKALACGYVFSSRKELVVQSIPLSTFVSCHLRQLFYYWVDSCSRIPGKGGRFRDLHPWSRETLLSY